MICQKINPVKIFRIMLGMFFCFFMAVNSFASDTEKPVLIKNVRIFDGKQVMPMSDVLFFEGRIVKVGQNITPPLNAEVIRGDDRTLLPGLIDAHVHIWQEQQLKQALVFGVTYVVDMSMSPKTMAAIKKKQAAGKTENMAGLISAGILATAPGGHGTEYGLKIPTILKQEEAQSFIDARIAEGSDFIKIICDDGSTFSRKIPSLNIETIKALIDAAHKRNKLAVVHIATLDDAEAVIKAGADGLAHLFWDGGFDPEFGKLAAKNGIFVIPTFAVIEGIAEKKNASYLTNDSNLSPYLNSNDIMMLKQTFPANTGKASYKAAQKALRQLKAEHVPILAGTDAPNPGTTYGASLHRELELLVEAGLTPLEALESATSKSAKIFNIEGRGVIKPGSVADLVLVKGDPIKNILATRNIITVWKNGVKVDRETYRHVIEQEKLADIKQKNALPPKGSESGLISDFETEKISANFGAGWSVSTDEMMGGKSTAKIQLVQKGAQGSHGAMKISGNVMGVSAYMWAGAFFSPGKTLMEPVNLSSKKSIVFHAKGDGRNYSVMVFAKSLGYAPAIQNFKSTSKWKEYSFTFEKFGIAGSSIMGIFIGGAPEKGDFILYIDNVRLK